jgi:hypothetical protein
VSEGAASAPAPSEPAWTRWLPLLLLPVSLLPDLAAAVPLRSYFFRDFTATFLPLRLFAARELREGRFPSWNPYLSEGSVQLPALYPLDLLHALWPSPVFVSWLLTLHLPLAALGGYWLARELGTTRVGAFAAGVVLSLGGFTLSCLNLYVFLQSLALAPFVAGLLRRAGNGGRRAVALSALLVALATTTLAVEFVAQAILLGIALAWLDAGRRGAARSVAGAALGLAVAGLPIAVLLGLLPETTRGAGLPADVALGNALHPVVLLQALMPRLFGLPQAPAEAWWGGRFFTKGTPYFLSVYCGPLVLALGGCGIASLGRRRALVLGCLGALGVWYAFGAAGGLAELARGLPLAGAFRFPSKALLLPQLVLAVAVAFGVGRLQKQRSALVAVSALTALLAGASLFIAAAVSAAPATLAAWAGVAGESLPAVEQAAWRDAALAVAVAAGAALIALLARRAAVSAPVAGVLIALLAAADLARAGAGINRQVAPAFFELSTPLSRLLSGAAARGRVFSYGVDRSPAFAGYVASAAPERTLGGFLAYRQVLGPYTNLIDGLPAAETKDLTAFAPRQRELDDTLLVPGRAADLVPWWRNAGVATVLSLDELRGRGLRPLGSAPAGPPGLEVRVYEVESVWPRAYVACRALAESSVEAAMLAPYAAGFDPSRDAVVSPPAVARCSSGTVRAGAASAGRSSWEAEADGAGVLVVRESWSRGWRASVDGEPVPLRRANGKHRAVAVPAGHHRIELWYEAPGLRGGALLSAVALLVAAAMLCRRRA